MNLKLNHDIITWDNISMSPILILCALCKLIEHVSEFRCEDNKCRLYVYLKRYRFKHTMNLFKEYDYKYDIQIKIILIQLNIIEAVVVTVTVLVIIAYNIYIYIILPPATKDLVCFFLNGA